MRVLRSVSQYMSHQYDKRRWSIVGHVAGTAAVVLFGWILWDIHMSANATTLSSELVASLSCIVIYWIAGIKGLQVYEHAQGAVAEAGVVQTEQQTVTSVATTAAASDDGDPEAAGLPK
jgi:uncharacterized membrane protein SirB2